MFDTLTATELDQLAAKLSGGGHKFYQVGAALAGAARARYQSGRGTCLDQADDLFWTERAHYTDAMYELHELGAEARALAAARRTDTANAV